MSNMGKKASDTAGARFIEPCRRSTQIDLVVPKFDFKRVLKFFFAPRLVLFPLAFSAWEQGKAIVQPHRMGDDRRRKPMALVTDGRLAHAHPSTRLLPFRD